MRYRWEEMKTTNDTVFRLDFDSYNKIVEQIPHFIHISTDGILLVASTNHIHTPANTIIYETMASEGTKGCWISNSKLACVHETINNNYFGFGKCICTENVCFVPTNLDMWTREAAMNLIFCIDSLIRLKEYYENNNQIITLPYTHTYTQQNGRIQNSISHNNRFTFELDDCFHVCACVCINIWDKIRLLFQGWYECEFAR